MQPDVWLIRHGETEWSATGRHTSATDVSLTPAGEAAARALAPVLAAHDFALVLASPATRSRTTARLAGFPDAEIEPDLREWDYGALEGLTTPDIRARGPEWSDWTVWRGPLPGGETVTEVAKRAQRVWNRVETAEGEVLLFGHGHQLRILAAVGLGLDPFVGSRLLLDPAKVSIIGAEHETRALRVWNRDA